MFRSWVFSFLGELGWAFQRFGVLNLTRNYHITFQVSTVVRFSFPKKDWSPESFSGCTSDRLRGWVINNQVSIFPVQVRHKSIQKKQHTMVKSNVMRAATIISRLQSSGDNPEKPGFAHATTDLCDSTTESNP